MRRSSRPFVYVLLWLATLASVLAPSSARAEDGPARKAVEEQRYDDARQLVQDDLASPVAAKRAPALEIAAVTYLLEGRTSEAQPYVHALYELAPAFQLSDKSLPPRVTDVFTAEAARPHSRAVSLAFRSGEDGSFVLEASARAKLSVSCRQGQSDFAPVNLMNLTPLRRGFRLPTTTVNSCFALALDEDALPVGRLASRSAPVTLTPETKPPKTVLTRWWFWTGVGAVLVGGAVLAYVETRPDHRDLPAAEVTATGSSRLVFH